MPASTNRSGLMGGLVALARAVGVRFPRAVCATRRRAQVRAAMYISLGDRLSVAALFHPLTEAVRCDARRRPGVAAPRKPILRTVAPLILIRLS